MITSLNPAPGKKARVPPKIAIKILGQICEEMHTDPKSLASIAKHQVIIDSTVSVCGVKQLDFYVSLCSLHIGARDIQEDCLGNCIGALLGHYCSKIMLKDTDWTLM